MDFKGIWSRLITTEQARRFLDARRKYYELGHDAPDPDKARKEYMSAVIFLVGDLLANLAQMRLEK